MIESRTAGRHVTMGVRLILTGEISTRGVLFPSTKEANSLVLNALEERFGIGYTMHDKKMTEPVVQD